MEPLLESGEAEPEVHELLTWARQHGGPNQEQLAGLSARLAPAVGLPLSALEGATQAVGTAPSGAALGGAGSGSLSPAAATTGLGGEALVTKLSGSLIAKASLAGLVGLGALAYVASRAPAPPASEKLPAASQQSAPEPEPAVEARVAPAPQAPPAEVVAPETREAAPEPAPVRRAAPAERPARVKPRPSELSLLQAAQEARGRPSAMLRALDRHARLYPEGMLAQERDVLRIEALVQRGRHEEAARRAADLERRHPGSAHLARVKELLAGPGGEP